MYQRYRLGSKGLFVSIAAFLLCIAVFVVLVIFTGRARADVDTELDCYFLVRNCDDSTSAAVVGEVYSAGGAGYLYGDSVIIACYYTKADARRVCSLLEGRGESVGILARSFEKLTLRGGDTEHKEEILGSIETAKSAARLLYDTANGLETGSLSQVSAKANVEGAADALEGVAASDPSLLDRWDCVLYDVIRNAREKSRGILFSKDVRFLQVSLCCAVLNIGQWV